MDTAAKQPKFETIYFDAGLQMTPAPSGIRRRGQCGSCMPVFLRAALPVTVTTQDAGAMGRP
jgi:hypothetical protein